MGILLVINIIDSKNIIDNKPLHIRNTVTKLTVFAIAKEVLVTLLVILILTSTVLVRRTLTNLEMRTVGLKLIVRHHYL